MAVEFGFNNFADSIDLFKSLVNTIFAVAIFLSVSFVPLIDFAKINGNVALT